MARTEKSTGEWWEQQNYCGRACSRNLELPIKSSRHSSECGERYARYDGSSHPCSLSSVNEYIHQYLKFATHVKSA